MLIETLKAIGLVHLCSSFQIIYAIPSKKSRKLKLEVDILSWCSSVTSTWFIILLGQQNQTQLSKKYNNEELISKTEKMLNEQRGDFSPWQLGGLFELKVQRVQKTYEISWMFPVTLSFKWKRYI